MRSIRDLLADQSVLAGLPDADLDLLAGCGKNVVFAPGEALASEGEAAETCFVLRSGRVALEVEAPGSGSTVVLTLGPGQLVGWSWLVPPHRWTADVRAQAEVHAVQLDGACLLQKCDDEPALGYRLMQRFSGVLADRLRATRLQLLDLYADRRGG